VIGISHDPDLFPTRAHRVALTFAGHTHGGPDCRAFVLQRRLLPSRFGKRYRRGAVEELERLLYISGGVGQAGIPVRLGVPPEVGLLELRSGG